MSSFFMEFTSYQIEAINFINAKKKVILEMGARTGKSLTSLGAATGSTYIVCSPALIPTWQAEIDKYNQMKKEPKYSQAAPIYLLKSTQKRLFSSFKPDTLIIDEIHNHNKWNTSALLLNMAKRSKKLIMISATPTINDIEELYWPLKLTNQINYSLDWFRQKYKGAKLFRFGKKHIFKGSVFENKEELLKLKDKVTFRYSRALKLKIQDINLDINFGTILDKISSHNKIKRFAKENLEFNLRKWSHDAPNKEVNKILDKHSKTVLCYFHTKVKNLVRQKIEEKYKDINILELHGRVPIFAREGIIRAFEESKRKTVLFLNYKSGGEGLNINGSNACCFIENTWSKNADYQAFMRLYGFQRTSPLHIYNIFSHEEHKLYIQRKKERITLQNA